MAGERDKTREAEDRKSEPDEQIAEAKGGRGGQPIGGNDSRTGSGTTLTSGYGGAGGVSSTSGSGVGRFAQPVGQDSSRNEYGEIGGEVDEPGSYAGGVSGRQAEREGFIAQPATGTDEDLQERGSSARATEGQDFAAE